MKKSLEKFEGKVVQFRLKSSCLVAHPNRHVWPDIGIVKMKKSCIFFQGGRLSRFDRLHIYSGKNAEFDWASHMIDMRTVKEIPEEEALIWKLDHNM